MCALLIDLFVLCAVCLTLFMNCLVKQLFFGMSQVFSSFKTLRAGSQVFALFMLFISVILHTMWLAKSMQLICILPLYMLCLSAISMMFVKNYVGSVYVGGYCGLSESGLCVFCEL